MSEQNPATIYLSKWSEDTDTHKTMKGALKKLAQVLSGKKDADAETFPWHELRYADARAVAAKLRASGNGKPLAVRTINKCLSALRGTLESAWRSGQMPDTVYRQIKIENERGRTLPGGHALDEIDTDKLVGAIAAASPQDAALITLLFACGLRRVEAVRMMVEDYDPTTGKIRAFGKGNKERTVPLAEGWRPTLERWRDTRPPRSFLFVDRKGKPLNRRGVTSAIARFCKTSGTKRFTPHDLRRSFSTGFLNRGGDIAALSRMLGHASIQTTIGSYDRRDDAGAEAVVASMPSPGRARG
jgi:integrase